MALIMYTVNWLSVSIPNLAALRQQFLKYANLKDKKLKYFKKKIKLIERTPAL